MAEKKQATWGGRFAEEPSALMQRFSESISFDARLAPFDVACSKAHSAMLEYVGIITSEEKEVIHTGLDQILEEISTGNFPWDIKLEDVHMNIEQRLTERYPEAARLHTARSRNDQVATDMRLYIKYACEELETLLKGLLLAIANTAEANINILIPGYTHLQRAQPVSVAHHLLAYAEMFKRDKKRILQVWESANICPLGSGAIAGTTLPINREYTAALLGFTDKNGHPQVTPNSMDTVADRDVFIEFAHACALMGIHFSRFSEDAILWNSSEFGFVNLPDTFTTGSSLMPQKKNPDAFELLRGKSARLQGNLQTLMTLCKGLPLTYNRDLQEDKPPLFDSHDQCVICLEVLTECIKGLQFNESVCLKAANDPLLLATDLVDYLVNKDIPFRKAHHIIGQLVALAEKKGLPLDQLPISEMQRISPAFANDWTSVFSLATALEKREKTGMPGMRQIQQQILKIRQESE